MILSVISPRVGANLAPHPFFFILCMSPPESGMGIGLISTWMQHIPVHFDKSKLLAFIGVGKIAVCRHLEWFFEKLKK